MATPVILLAFANDRQGQFLRQISGEQRAISQALDDLRRKGLCEVIVLSDAKIEDIRDAFRNYRGRIRIFHYGGHADDYQLILDSSYKETLDRESLSAFLGAQSGLELVFLNGCATKDHKDTLLEAGVPRVILTSQAINDLTGREFAKEYYRQLASGNSIKKSFQQSSLGLNLSKNNQFRSIFLEEVEESEIPWEYDEIVDISEWEIPKRRFGLIHYGLIGSLLLLGLLGIMWKFQPTPEPFSYAISLIEPLPLPHLSMKDATITLRASSFEQIKKTSSLGETVFTQIPPHVDGEEVHVYVESKGYLPVDTIIQLFANKSLILPIKRDCSLCIIKGSIVDDSYTPTPLGDVLVSVGAYQAKTLQNGYFELKIPFEAQDSVQTLSAFKEGYKLWERQITILAPPHNVVELVLQRK